MPLRAESVEPFLRGCVFPAAPDVPYPRADPAPLGDRLPRDTWAAASVPVGVRLEFVGDARAIEIEYETRTDDLGYRGDGAGLNFTLLRAGEAVVEAAASLGRGTLILEAGANPDARAIVHLPEGMKPEILALRAVEGSIEPAPRQPRWLCYGDSIAEGWVARGPAWCWPAIAGRALGLDCVNLGYAGSARGEVVSAEQIAELPAQLISISHGTNCWSRTPHSLEAFRAGLGDFLSVVREGHASTPIVAVSPIARPDAEATANRLGATLSDLRATFEQVVRERQTGGDAMLTLVEGVSLVSHDQLPDGIHPGDEGHAAMAAAIAPVLAQALGR